MHTHTNPLYSLFFVLVAWATMAAIPSIGSSDLVTQLVDPRVDYVTSRIKSKNKTTPARRIAKAIVKSADAEGIDPFFVATIVEIESRYHVMATGLAGERGLMQMSKDAGDRCGLDWNNAYDIEANIAAGACYLAIHMKTYRGQMERAAYRYNGGGDPKYLSKFITRYTSIVRSSPTVRTVIVAPGDTLSILAEKHLGNLHSYNVLAKFNDLDNPDKLAIGQVIRIPGSGQIT